MTIKKIRFGIIGCGLMGREFASVAARWCHLLNLDVQPRIVAVCDVNPHATAWFERAIPTLRLVTSDYHELLADPEIDAIYCALPHHLHAQTYRDIILAGKHLLGEKPYGMDGCESWIPWRAFILPLCSILPDLCVSVRLEPGGEQEWRVIDMPYQSAYPTITGAIFEFGFSDSLLQMWAAFCDELAHGSAMYQPLGCVTSAETRDSHTLFTAALASQKLGQTIVLN